MTNRLIVGIGPGPFDESEAGEQLIPSDMRGVAGVFVGGCVAKGVPSRLDKWSHKGACSRSWRTPGMGLFCSSGLPCE